MLNFLLDLDGTAVVAKKIDGHPSNEINYINASHQLSKILKSTMLKETDTGVRKIPVEFQIINPVLLAKVINKCYELNGEVRLFTSGNWISDIGALLAENLPLTEKAKKGLSSCRLHSPYTDQLLFPDQTIKDIKLMRKGVRLKEIVNADNNLNNAYWVFFDDNIFHINSVKDTFPHNASAILATTNKDDKRCYDEVISALELNALVDESTDETQLLFSSPAASQLEPNGFFAKSASATNSVNTKDLLGSEDGAASAHLRSLKEPDENQRLIPETKDVSTDSSPFDCCMS